MGDGVSGVFISYRRADSLPWAGRLYDTLCSHFDKKLVFMDINGGIPRGTNFETVLNDAVSSCDALLALIGPGWLASKRSDGMRRLDNTEDWVRREIAMCLHRPVPVVPVLFGGASLPGDQDLPDELRPLCKQQAAVIADTDWHDHAAGLINDLLRVTPLTLAHALERDDVDSANSGIQLLSTLLVKDPAVAAAVGRSREVVENTYRGIDRLDMFKTVHDALHTIEFECLRPLSAAEPTVRLRLFRSAFTSAASRIRATIDGHDLNPALRDDIADGLDATDAAFLAAVQQPGEPAFSRVILELNGLLSGLPARLDAGIYETARNLDLQQLGGVMATVKTSLEAPIEDPALARFVDGIDALQRLGDELHKRVEEHTQLQRLDSKLRTVCVAGVPVAGLAAEWIRIKRIRAGLATPFSSELAAAVVDWDDVERDVDAKLAAGEEPAAVDFVREYFRLIALTFRDVDRALKQFCFRLGTVSQPLKTILDLY
jgi:hypothetical protein